MFSLIIDAAFASFVFVVTAVTQGVPQGLVLGPLFRLHYCPIYYAHKYVNIEAIVILHLLFNAEAHQSTRTKCAIIQQVLKVFTSQTMLLYKEKSQDPEEMLVHMP